MRRYLFVLLILTGCGPSTPEEYRSEGESILRHLQSDLNKVESLVDLKVRAPRIKKKFTELTELMIRIKKTQLTYPADWVQQPLNTYLSDQLKTEFIRIYQIDGCQKLMEDLQRESLHRLDRCE